MHLRPATMNTTYLTTALLLNSFLQCYRVEAGAATTTPVRATTQPCEKETDLDYVTCTLDDLNDDDLRNICQRIGLDAEANVLSYLLESDEDNTNAEEGDDGERKYSHTDFVKAAEECLSIENEMDQQQPERNIAQQDIEILITDILIQDEQLLKEIVAKLSKERPATLEEIKSNGIMEEGEGLEDRPDIVGFYLAYILSEDSSLLGELGSLLSISEQSLLGGDDPGWGWGGAVDAE